VGDISATIPKEELPDPLPGNQKLLIPELINQVLLIKELTDPLPGNHEVQIPELINP
jgi:hypothetical protein